MAQKLYLSGSVSALMGPEIDKAREYYEKIGWEVKVIPPDAVRAMTLEESLRAGLELLIACDAIALLPFWASSRRALLESLVAKTLGMPMFDAQKRSMLSVPQGFYNSLPPLSDSGEKMEQEVEPSSESIVEEAIRLVSSDRSSAYGHPLDDFTKTAAIWSALLGTPVTPEQVGLCMVGVKLSREAHAHKRDNLVDALGYILTVEKVREERERRKLLEPDPELEDLPF